MKFLVCISKAPDTTSKVAFVDNQTKFDENGVQFIINPYDEWYALVRALEIKEQSGGTVTTISVGGPDNDPIIRKALAIGADDAVRIDAPSEDPYGVASEIAAYAKDKGYDIVFCGKETINYNGSVVPGLVAEFLNLPYVALATKIDINGGVATMERDAAGGKEVVECKLPLVLSASKGMAEQRIPNMRGIMAARTKPLTVVPSSGASQLTEVVSYALPKAKGDCKYLTVDQVDELVQLLHNEAKVI